MVVVVVVVVAVGIRFIGALRGAPFHPFSLSPAISNHLT